MRPVMQMSWLPASFGSFLRSVHVCSCGRRCINMNKLWLFIHIKSSLLVIEQIILKQVQRSFEEAYPTDSARYEACSSEKNTWQANLWCAGCLVISPKYLMNRWKLWLGMCKFNLHTFIPWVSGSPGPSTCHAPIILCYSTCITIIIVVTKHFH